MPENASSIQDKIDLLCGFAEVKISKIQVNTGPGEKRPAYWVSVIPEKAALLWWYNCQESLTEALDGCIDKAKMLGFLK